MRKVVLLGLSFLFFISCSNKENEAINIANKWVSDNIFRFYENPRLEDSEYIFKKYDTFQFMGMEAKLDSIQLKSKIRKIEDSNWDEKDELRQSIFYSEKSAYEIIKKTENPYILVSVSFSSQKEQSGRHLDDVTVILDGNSLSVLNPLIKRVITKTDEGESVFYDIEK